MRAVAPGAKSKRPAGAGGRGRGRKGARRGKGRARGLWPRRLFVTMLAVLVLGAGYVMSVVGYGSRAGETVVEALSDGADTALRLLGISVQNVTVNGRRFSQAREILDALDVTRGGSMVRFDPAKARRRVLDVDWVRDATVSRLYPGTIHVNVTEYIPFALWRHEGRTSVISENGEVVSSRNISWLDELPVVEGDGAARAAAKILPLLKERASLRSRIRVIERVGGRRWNLRLANEVNVMLPATRVAAALDVLIAIDQRTGLLERDIAFVDMRIPDRVTVRTMAGAVTGMGLQKGSGRTVADKKT